MPWNMPDDIGENDSRLCLIEGCEGKGPCPRCGEVNYRLMGYYGAVARWAKEWGVSQEEAERRISRHETARLVKAGEICGTCGFPPDDVCCQSGAAHDEMARVI